MSTWSISGPFLTDLGLRRVSFRHLGLRSYSPTNSLGELLGGSEVRDWGSETKSAVRVTPEKDSPNPCFSIFPVSQIQGSYGHYSSTPSFHKTLRSSGTKPKLLRGKYLSRISGPVGPTRTPPVVPVFHQEYYVQGDFRLALVPQFMSIK